MDLKDSWKELLATVAPTIATALGGPLAGIATRTIATAVLGKADASEEEIATAITGATPDQLHKLKEAENQFKVELKKLDVDLEKIASADRASAREREAKVGGWTNPILAGVVITGFFAVVAYVLTDPETLTAPAAGIMGTLIGYVSAKADQVIVYYFGSSAGSSRKTDMLRDLASKGKL